MNISALCIQTTTIVYNMQNLRFRNAVLCIMTGDIFDAKGVNTKADIRFILHRTKQDTIGLPGGRIDPIRVNGKHVRDETPEETAVREFYEETNVRVRFVKHVGDDKVGSDGSHPIIVMDTTVIGDTVVFVAKWLCNTRMNTDAWKSSAKAQQETSGVYATKIADIMAYDGKPGTKLRHGGKHHVEGTRVRGCAIGSVLYIQSIIRRFNLA